jgi:hypothetical protein
MSSSKMGRRHGPAQFGYRLKNFRSNIIGFSSAGHDVKGAMVVHKSNYIDNRAALWYPEDGNWYDILPHAV